MYVVAEPVHCIPFAGSSHVHAYKLSNERVCHIPVYTLDIPAVQVLYTLS